MVTMRLPRRLGAAAIALLVVTIVGGTGFLLAACGPFTDVGSQICPFVLELYYTGITAGTSSTTYSPNDPVTRGQMAIFIATTLDPSLTRGGRRAALNQWWTTTPHYDVGLGLTTVGSSASDVQSDGADVWVADTVGSAVVRVRASDGAVLGTWTGATAASGILVAMGRVFVAGQGTPGTLSMLDPTQAPGNVTMVSTTTPLGALSQGIAFDGNKIWTANYGDGSISIITPGATMPWSSFNVTGFVNPCGLSFDGANMWLVDRGGDMLYKLDPSGNILLTVPLGSVPGRPIFDGRNIWVPNSNDSTVTVVAAHSGAVLATLPENGQTNQPISGAFDGQRILVANFNSSVSLWKAADLTPLGTIQVPPNYNVQAACSDGLNFWIGLKGNGTPGTAKVARF